MWTKLHQLILYHRHWSPFQHSSEQYISFQLVCAFLKLFTYNIFLTFVKKKNVWHKFFAIRPVLIFFFFFKISLHVKQSISFLVKVYYLPCFWPILKLHISVTWGLIPKDKITLSVFDLPFSSSSSARAWFFFCQPLIL